MKAGIWLRVSTADQSEDAQYPDCAAYAERNGYEIDPECVYQVHGASARKGNRRFDDAWNRVLEDVKHGRIKVLIVWRLSRLDRKLAATRMIGEVLDAGGRVEFANQPHLNNLSTMAGRISLKIEEEIAYAESEEKSQRTTASISLRKTHGKNTGRYPWGFIPEKIENANGVLVSTGVLLATEEGRKWVPFAFEKIVSGRAPGEVAAMLRAEGVHPTCHGLYIQRMIANEKYRGTLVDSVTWDAANLALESAPKRGRSPKVGDKPLLSPKCGRCGGPMYAHLPPRGDGQPKYRCHGRNNDRSKGRHDIRGCGGPLINMAEADYIVTAMFTDDSPHMEWKYVPGDDIDRKVRDLRDRAATALRNGDYKTATGLMAEAEGLEASPRTEAGWREMPSGQTRRQWWEGATQDDRRAYLARYVFTLGKNPDGNVSVNVSAKER